MRRTPEGRFKQELNDDIYTMFDGCVVLMNDSTYMQGIPDMLILFEDKWAMLEVKESANAKKQPNQDYYVDLFDGMSFAAFIYPENKEEVLRDLQLAFRSRR